MSARPKSRGMVRGFVGRDGSTHADEAPGTLRRMLNGRYARCDFFNFGAPSQQTEVPFIASPKYPLCRACVAAIESEVRGEQ